MWRRMHQSIPEQGKWLRRVVRGYFNYHAVPTNACALHVFLPDVTDIWRRRLRRRSQKDRKHEMSRSKSARQLSGGRNQPQLCCGPSTSQSSARSLRELRHRQTEEAATDMFGKPRRSGRNAGSTETPSPNRPTMRSC
jgi:hypothetical protein